MKRQNGVGFWYEFDKEHGEPPTRQDFIDNGYSVNYYYCIRKQIKQIEFEELQEKVRKALSISEMV